MYHLSDDFSNVGILGACYKLVSTILNVAIFVGVWPWESVNLDLFHCEDLSFLGFLDCSFCTVAHCGSGLVLWLLAFILIGLVHLI